MSLFYKKGMLGWGGQQKKWQLRVSQRTVASQNLYRDEKTIMPWKLSGGAGFLRFGNAKVGASSKGTKPFLGFFAICFAFPR